MTALFAYVLTGYLCRFQHMVCKQQEITLRVFEAKTCELDEIFTKTQVKINSSWPFIHKFEQPTEIPENYKADGYIFNVMRAQIHLTAIAIVSCFISPLMRFAAGTINRAFGIKEDSTFFGAIFETLSRDSSLTDIFYCHGMVGVLVLLYLQ